jgi:opacity protein-like surface antigen
MRTLIRIMAVVLVAAAIGAIVPCPADAQSYTAVRPGGRGGNWEIFLPLIYSDSATVKGEGGSKVDINSDWGFGFGAGYNVSDNFQINGMFTWSYKSYNATSVNPDGSVARQYSNYMDTSTLSLNGVYYIMKGNITPFVSAGVGITYVDTNIPTGGSGTSSCWYDPWYGYVCSSYVPTKTENDITYNAGIGVRFDANSQFALQFGYYKTWIDVSKASSTPDFDIWRLDFIFRM